MRPWRLRPYLMACLSLLVVLALAGCSHGQTGAPEQVLYVAMPQAHSVALFPVSAQGPAAPLKVIRERDSDIPVDVSVDLMRDVFIANQSGNVKVYGGPRRDFELIHNLEGPHTRLGHLNAIVADNVGSFYVTDAGEGPAQPPRVEWFAGGQNGNIVPNRVLSGPHTGITTPRGIATDGSGRVYVVDQGSNKVLVFDSNAEGDVAPLATIEGLRSPDHVHVDDLLDVFVTNQKDNSISVFVPAGPQSWVPGTTITGASLRDIRGITSDSNERLVVATSDGVLYFAPNTQGAATPVQTLTGPSHMDPDGIVIR
jgi:hypothetical protein